MRIYLSLIITAVILAFMSGYAFLFVQDRNSASVDDVNKIALIKYEFQKEISPFAIVNFSSIYYSNDQIKLIDPLYIVSDHGIDEKVTYSTNKDCFKNWKEFSNNEGMEKIWLWENFRCGRIRSLPESFFNKAPFIHPSGKSYAFLAFSFSSGLRNSKGWVLKNLSLFHVTELSEVKERVGRLGGIYDLLATLDLEILHLVVKGQGSILSKRYLLARIRYGTNSPILEYRFYWRDDLDKFLEKTPFVLSNYKTGRPCFFKDGELCWDFNIKHLFQLANKGTIVLLIGLIFICILIVRLLVTKIRQQRFEEMRKRMALQVLTHEFRTPVTSLLLLMERGSHSFNKLDEEMQDIFLRVSSEIYRLQRLTEKSQNYLQLSQSGRLIELKKEEVPSIENVILDVAQIYEERDLRTDIPDGQTPLLVDVYWLQMAVKNIIENAYYHGAPPVMVRLLLDEQFVRIEVEDAGDGPDQSLESITKEFFKGTKSQGSGLGMNIVKNIVDEMGGMLELFLHPTRFAIVLKRARKDQDFNEYQKNV